MKAIRATLSAFLTMAPLVGLLAYGLLVTTPPGQGQAARSTRLTARPDERVEMAAILSRVAGDLNAPWPSIDSGGAGGDSDAQVVRPMATDPGNYFNRFQNHPAVLRVRALRQRGMTAEILAGVFLTRGTWPGMEPTRNRIDPEVLGRLPGGDVFGPRLGELTPAVLDSLVAETKEFAAASRFDSVWSATSPALHRRAEEIESDPTLKNLAARLSDFFGEPAREAPVVLPTHFGPWKSPFAWPDEESGELQVIDRASGAGRLTPETSLSWVCVREFARPTVERLARSHADRIGSLSGYWSYLKQGVAATSTAGWEDCFNAHLYRAIDLRVRAQEDGVERELRISSALAAGLGMIRAIDQAMTGYDRGRNFYRRFTDYYPTFLEEMAGLEARVRVERPRLGLKVTPVSSGLRIDEILRGHSADGSALKPGDIIVEADLRPVLSEELLAQIVQSHKIGTTLKMEIERDGRRVPIDLVLSKGRIEYEFFKPAPPATAGAPAAPGAGAAAGN